MQTAKETAANLLASSRAGLEKTKATVQEKVDLVKTSDPMQKEMATKTKEEKIQAVERQKQEARQQNSAAKHEEAVGGYGHGFTAGADIDVNAVGRHPPAEGAHDGGHQNPNVTGHAN